MPKRLTDTTRNKLVHVRAAQIATAVRRDSHHCMVADAVAEAVPGAAHISVDIQSIRWSDLKTGKRFVYLTPHAVQQALLRFDAGKPVKPFTFMLWADAGFEKPMRVRQDPTPEAAAARDARYAAKRNERKRALRKGAPKTRPMPTKFREFGLRKFTDPGVDVSTK